MYILLRVFYPTYCFNENYYLYLFVDKNTKNEYLESK